MENIESILKKNIEDQKLLSPEILDKYMMSEIKKRKLENQIKKISIDSSNDSKYDSNENYININPFEMLNLKKTPKHYMINLLNKKNINIHNNNYLNAHTLYIINHELEHAEQFKLMSNETYFYHFPNYEKIKLLFLIKSSLLQYNSNIYFDDNIYKKYHDYFIDEYYADINSFINTLDLLNSLDIDKIKNVILKFNILTARYILYSYKDIKNNKISTPYNNFTEVYNYASNILNMNNIKFIDLSDLDTNINYSDIDMNYKYIHLDNEIDRLKLGLSIKKDTYNYLKSISRKKNKTLNLFKDLENI